jgi:topoisomerase IA-like protein
MENKLGFLGKHNETSVFLNMGKFGYYLNFDDKLYSVPACFQDKKFNLESAIKIIEYKSKLIKEEKKLETDSTETNIDKIMGATTYDEVDDIVKSIKNKKSIKKSND